MISNSSLNQAEKTPINSDEATIRWLLSLNQLEYERARKETAKNLGVRPNILDQLVKKQRDQSTHEDSDFEEVEPWPEPLKLCEVADEVYRSIKRFIILDEHQAQAATLWIIASWFVDEINCAPILLINAPEKACGKTQLLTVLAKLANKSVQASSITVSVLFRLIEKHKPTLFIDEIETILKENEELRGVINAGHTRDSAFVWRSVAKSDDYEPKKFFVWGMKAIAGINAVKLAETVTSRSIIIQLRRKKPDEKVERLRHVEDGMFHRLKSKLARCALDYYEEIKKSKPYLPDQLSDRDQDNWEPLMQVSLVAGDHWPETAYSAALKIQTDTQAPQSSSNEMLSDIHEIFEQKQFIKIKTKDLIAALCEDDEKQWATYNRGKSITPKQLATKLKDYGISSKTIRFDSYSMSKGYEIEMFKDAFERYLVIEEKSVTA